MLQRGRLEVILGILTLSHLVDLKLIVEKLNYYYYFVDMLH